MANYTSQLLRRRRATEPLNTEAIGFVLQSKENKWNANQAKIDEKLSQIGSLDLIRDQDKEHVLKNVERLLGNISNAGSLDYSSNTVARELDSAIMGAVDDHTINQVVNTRKIKQFGSQVQQVKEKNRELYNDANYQYAVEKGGLQNYMSGNSDEVGNLEYTPYTDVNAELSKKIKDAVTIKGGKRVVQTRDFDGSITGVPGTIIEKTVDGMTQQEIASILPTFLDSKAQKQLEIDGYFQFNGDTNLAQESIGTYKTSVLESLDTDISNIRTKIKSGTLDRATEELYKNSLSKMETYRDDTEKQLDDISTQGADKIGGFLKQRQTIETLSNTLKGYESEKYLKDNAYFANLEMQEKARHNRAKEQKSREESSFSTLPDAVSTPIPTDILDTINTYDEVKKEATKINQEYQTLTNISYSKLTPEQKVEIDNLTKDKKYEGLSDIDKRSKALRDSDSVDPNTKTELNRLQREYNNYLEDDQQIYESNLDTEYNKPETYEALVNNTNIKIVDDNGQSVPYSEYFKNQGIETESEYLQFINDPIKSKVFKARVASDFLLSSDTSSSLTITPLVNNNLGKVLQGREAGNINESLLMQFDRLTKVLGENKQFTDIFEVTKREIGFSDNGETKNYLPGSGTNFGGKDAGEADMQYILNHRGDAKEKYNIKLKESAKGTETYRIIKEGLKKGTFDTSSVLGEFLPDNSVQDDSTLRNSFSFDNFQKNYKEQVAQRGIRVKGFNQITITPSSGEKNKKPIFESLRTAIASGQQISDIEPLQKLQDKVGVSLRQQGDNFIVTQQGKSIMVEKRVLQQFPDINNRIELEQNKANLVIENRKPLELKAGDISYKKSDTKALTYLGNKYGFNSTTYLASTVKGAKIMLEKTNPDIFSNNGGDNPWKNTFDTALDNYSKFSVKMQNTGGQNYVEVFYDDEKVSEVAQNIPQDNIVDIVDSDPQVFITLALNNIAIETRNKDNENFAKLYNKINAR